MEHQRLFLSTAVLESRKITLFFFFVVRFEIVPSRRRNYFSYSEVTRFEYEPTHWFAAVGTAVLLYVAHDVVCRRLCCWARL